MLSTESSLTVDWNSGLAAILPESNLSGTVESKQGNHATGISSEIDLTQIEQRLTQFVHNTGSLKLRNSHLASSNSDSGRQTQSKQNSQLDWDELIGKHQVARLAADDHLSRHSTTRLSSTQSLPRTVTTFDLSADLTSSKSFYDLPYPLDLRLDSAGRPKLSGFPIWGGNPVLKGLRNIADDRPGFPVTTAGYFRFNFPLAPQNSDQLIAPSRNASVMLLDIDPNSPDRGQLFPVVATTPRPDLNYVPDFLLSVAPYPGVVLHPDRRYAYVVRRSLKDATGRLLGVPSTLQQLVDGETPDGPRGAATRRLYQPLWKTLDNLDIDRKSVAAATVFTTGDVVSDTAKLSQQVVDRYDLNIEELKIDPTDGANHPGFYELHGTIRLPQFQRGTPPFNTGGLFAFSQNGTLIEQRTEAAPVVITLPKTPMPQGGYPFMVYYHGSNGLSTQVVDRGSITTPGGNPTPGEGPAAVAAQYGIASIGIALPLNPERLPNGPSDAYLNFLNLAAYRDTFRQGILEQRLLLESLRKLEISPTLLPDLAKQFLPSGQTTFQLQDSAAVVLGQSHGSQYANMVAAVEPMVRAVVPTGANGFWPLLASKTQQASLIGLALGTLQPLNFLFPGLQLLETAWEAADPIAYVPRLAKRPLPGHPVRSVYQPVGLGDTEIPQDIFNTLALATGVQQAGELIWPEMQTSLALEKLDKIQPYPVSHNLKSENGTPYTGVVVQYRGDGIADPHTIFSQLDAVKYQYGTFFKTLFDSLQTTGIAKPVVAEPLSTLFSQPFPSLSNQRYSAQTKRVGIERHGSKKYT